MKHQLHFEQVIPASIDEVWNFFSDSRNLNLLTPPEMKMKLISDLSDYNLFEGMKISYYVSPILSIPIFWETEIIKVIQLKEFIDVQNKGPFKLWKHTHQFIPKDNRVLMIDDVEYILPFGKIGNLFHRSLVYQNLIDLFEFRKKACEEIFIIK